MNKYDSKTGVTMFLIMVLLCFATVFCYILWATSGIWIFAIVFTIILLVGYVPIYFFTNYEIDATYLHIRMGFFKKQIPIDKIEAIYPTRNWVFSYATSYQRITIIYNDNGKIKKVYVSPFLYAAFLNDLTDLTLDNAVLNNPAPQEQVEVQKEVEAEKPAEQKPAKTKRTSPTKTGAKKAKKATAPIKKAGRPKKKA